MPSTTQRISAWLSSGGRQRGDRRLSLDSYGSSKLEKAPSSLSKQSDLESQISVPIKKETPNSAIESTPTPPNICHDSPTTWQKLRAWKPSKEIIYNAILGTSDGMTVPFAVTASLAGVADARLVMMAGLAELIAGSISMAAGGVIGARSEV